MSTYACADLHGRLDLFYQIQSFLGDSDKLYIIGDVLDRGPDSWKLLKVVLKDPRCTLMKGNHEDMCYNGTKEILHGDYYNSAPLWFYNGGNVTYEQMLEEKNFTDLLPVLRRLILETEYTNQDGIKFILNHSGFYSPKEEKNNSKIIWDREQYKYYFNHSWEGPEDVIVVHGHTPIPIMIEEYKKIYPKVLKALDYEDGALWYANNHKVNLDTGACWTGQTVMLDLDTLDEHIFGI